MRLSRTGSPAAESKESQKKATHRLLINHCPTGEFRVWFFPHLPSQCTCGRTQTRNHILFECLRYVRPRLWFHSHAAFSSHPSNIPLLLQWLQLNPVAFTFDVPPDPTNFLALGLLHTFSSSNTYCYISLPGAQYFYNLLPYLLYTRSYPFTGSCIFNPSSTYLILKKTF